MRRVKWPERFRPNLPPRYDGTTSPVEFLLLYISSVCAVRGDDRVMANWLPLALKGAARSWFMGLPEASITSWEDLCEHFVSNFKDTGGFAPAEGSGEGPLGSAGGSQGPRVVACILSRATTPTPWPASAAGVAAGAGRASAPSHAPRPPPGAGGAAREVPPSSSRGSGSGESQRDAPQGEPPSIFFVIL